MKTNTLVKADKEIIILKEYSTPILEKHGELHKLTHGEDGDQMDAGNINQYFLPT